MVQMLQLPRENPYIDMDERQLKLRAWQLEEALLEVRPRSAEERRAMRMDLALFLRAMYFTIGRDPERWSFPTAHGAGREA